MTLTVNRTLADKDMDRIDHALGRPLDPMGATYRNHYAVNWQSDLAVGTLRRSDHWECEHRAVPGDGLSYFTVTQAGREALTAHLKAIKDPWRAYVVGFEGQHAEFVAKSHGQARYSAWGSVVDQGISFIEFARACTCRLARTLKPEVVF